MRTMHNAQEVLNKISLNFTSLKNNGNRIIVITNKSNTEMIFIADSIPFSVLKLDITIHSIIINTSTKISRNCSISSNYPNCR